MLFDRPVLVTDSIIENIISEKPLHIYRVMQPTKYNNKLCIISVSVIILFLVYKKYIKNQQLQRQRMQKKLEELHRQSQQESQPNQVQTHSYPYISQPPMRDTNYIPDIPEPYVENFSQQTNDNKNNQFDQQISVEKENIHLNQSYDSPQSNQSFDSPQINNYSNQEPLNETTNDRLIDTIHNIPNYKVKETTLPNINYKNTTDINTTDPMDLIRPTQNEMPKELSFDDLQKLRSLQDSDIKKIFNDSSNTNVDIRKTTSYNNKKDHRNDNNMKNIQQEVQSEQKLHGDNLGSSTLGADDSLSFSFL